MSDTESTASSHRWVIVREWTSNLFVAAFYGWFALNFAADVVRTGNWSSALYLFMESIIVLFALVRAIPKETSWKPYDWFIGIAGTTAALLFRPSAGGGDVLLLTLGQFAGVMVTVMGLLSLNTSYGTIAANRGIKRDFMYRVVRHPLYAGYTLSTICFVGQHPSGYNIAILAAAITLLVLRINAEEALLGKDPEYQELQKQTPYRLIPLVW